MMQVNILNWLLAGCRAVGKLAIEIGICFIGFWRSVKSAEYTSAENGSGAEVFERGARRLWV